MLKKEPVSKTKSKELIRFNFGITKTFKIDWYNGDSTANIWRKINLNTIWILYYKLYLANLVIFLMLKNCKHLSSLKIGDV